MAETFGSISRRQTSAGKDFKTAQEKELGARCYKTFFQRTLTEGEGSVQLSSLLG